MRVTRDLLPSSIHFESIKQATNEVAAQLFPEALIWGVAVPQDKTIVEIGDVAVSIAFSGHVRGHVSFGYSRESAKKVASRMLREQVETLDELAVSALSELGNMIAGTARAYINKGGIEASISPPAIVIGDAVSSAWEGVLPTLSTVVLGSASIQVAVGIIEVQGQT